MIALEIDTSVSCIDLGTYSIYLDTLLVLYQGCTAVTVLTYLG